MAALIIFAGGVATKTRGGWLAIAFSFLISIPMFAYTAKLLFSKQANEFFKK